MLRTGVRLLCNVVNVGIRYDYNGNTLTKVVGSNTTSYAWDFENRLSNVTLSGSGGTVSFKYDPFGRRIYKSSSSGTSIFAYDGDSLVEETNSSGTAVARYAEGLNIDEPLALLRGGATSFYHADGLGSVTSLSSSAGSIANTYTYDSFGNLTNSTGSLTNSFRYTAREFDSETSLYYYRARYYDQSTGRFLSEDPSGFNGDDVNLYRYAKESPPNLSDPSGLNPGAGSIPWPKVLPWPVASPWARAIGGWLGLLLSDFAWPDATNKEPQCDRRKDDPCYMQYMEDASWCADTFTGADDTLYNHCMAIAWFNYISCKEGRDRVKRDPRDYPKPTNRPVKKPNE